MADVRPDGQRVTLQDVADRAGVSLTTASRVVNDGSVGTLARLRAAGIDVPGDIGLAGFGDIPTLRDVYPPLTTVRLQLRRLGEIAARLVLSDDAPRPRVVPVSGEVVLRDSARPRPPSAEDSAPQSPTRRLPG